MIESGAFKDTDFAVYVVKGNRLSSSSSYRSFCTGIISLAIVVTSSAHA